MAGLLEYTKNGQVTEPPLYRFMRGNVQSFLNSIPDPSGLTREEQLNLAANVTPTIGLLGTFIGKGSKLWNSTTIPASSFPQRVLNSSSMRNIRNGGA